MLLKRLRYALTLAAAIGLVAGCDALTAPDEWEMRREAFERSSERWRGEGIDAYSYTSLAYCECLPASVGPVEITVEDGRISSLTPLQRDEPVPEEQWDAFWTVEELFDLVERGLEERARQLHVSYDTSFGYPRKVDLDFEEQVTDDEFFIQISEFTAIER